MINGTKSTSKWVCLTRHPLRMVDLLKMPIKSRWTSNERKQRTCHHLLRYLFAFEDLSKKLGSMNAPSAYFGGRTSMGSDSRRSLIRVRQQQEEEKKAAKPKATPASVKQRVHCSVVFRGNPLCLFLSSLGTKEP